MEILEILGFAGAVLVGLILGLVGGGGAMLTLPILVYLLGINPIVATGYSLFIVGITSFVGTLRNIKEKKINFKVGLLFTLPTLLVLYGTRSWLLPTIPNTILSLGHFELSKATAIMILFAVVMLLAASFMISGNKNIEEPSQETKVLKLIFAGIGVGLLSGLVGAGGGFIIIPALILFAKMPMKNAVATSIFIISLNSLLGFIGENGDYTIDWYFLFIFSTLSIIGIFLGIYLSRFVTGTQLKKGFGFFILAMATVIILMEIMS